MLAKLVARKFVMSVALTLVTVLASQPGARAAKKKATSTQADDNASPEAAPAARAPDEPSRPAADDETPRSATPDADDARAGAGGEAGEPVAATATAVAPAMNPESIHRAWGVGARARWVSVPG